MTYFLDAGFWVRITCICLLALFFYSDTALSKEAIPFVIMKTEGEPPRVDAASVDRVGASALYKMLGEDFIVVTSPTPVSPDVSLSPIVLPPGTIPPHIPICQCPEDYRAALEQRFSTIEIGKLLQTQPSIGSRELETLPTFRDNEFLVPQIMPGLGGN
ncbi:MAG: hypothetical protein GY748_16435 [Planctomycetaceae bacterium]|nr:hypothetical protein [Planctomycetaceae bacterium]